MLTLLSLQFTPTDAAIYWAYVPDPPVLHPTSWTEHVIPVYTNCSWALGGPADTHIYAISHNNFSYIGQSSILPVCFTTQHKPGCILMAPTSKASGIDSTDPSSYTGWIVTLSGLTRAHQSTPVLSPNLSFFTFPFE